VLRLGFVFLIATVLYHVPENKFPERKGGRAFLPVPGVSVAPLSLELGSHPADLGVVHHLSDLVADCASIVL
jgi:hypothetical protein